MWEVASALIHCYGDGELRDASSSDLPHEAKMLMLNIEKAKTLLGWSPRMDFRKTIELVVDWYKRYRTEDVYQLCVEEIKRFIN